MKFWDTWGETITSKGKKVAGKAKGMADVANLKGQIVTMEAALNRSYKELGMAYYEIHKEDKVDCELQEMVVAVKEAQEAILELKGKIVELKGQLSCPICGAIIQEDSCFCHKCGAKIEIVEEFYDEEDIFEDESEEALEEEVEEVEEIVMEEATSKEDVETGTF